MGKKALFSLVGVALFVAALSGVAWAHPAYKASSPPSGGSVSSPPGEVWVDFTEQIDGGRLEVFDACGNQVDNGDSTENLTSDRLTVTLSASYEGTYRVDWSVLGSDGHPTKGSFTFTASSGEPCPGEEPPPEQREPENRPEPRGEREQPPSTNGGTDPSGRREGTDDPTRSQGGNGARQDGRQRSDARSGGGGGRAPRTDIAAPEGDVTGEPASAPGIWDGIPLGDFLVALGVAAVIGAAGGRIYAGIMGPAPPR